MLIAPHFLHYLCRQKFFMCIQTDVTSETMHLPPGARGVSSEYFHLLFAVIRTLLDLSFVQHCLISVCNMQHCSQLHHIITLAHDAQGSLYATSHPHPSFFKSSRCISREVMGKAVACGCCFFISFSQFLSS